MKQYLVTEEELYKTIEAYINNGLGNMDAELLTSAILKSKQPVEIIAEGKIEADDYGIWLGGGKIERIWDWLINGVKKYIGKNISIYIRENKEE